MKRLSLGILIVVSGFIFGICCLGAAPPSEGGDDAKAATSIQAEDNNELETEQWVDEDGEEDEWEEGEEEFDLDRELQWQVAEQEMMARSIALTTEVANDEVKTAVVTATLLIEHTELSTAIDSLTRAINKTSSSAVKRALRLKLAEAHLENDDLTSAVSVATLLMGGE